MADLYGRTTRLGIPKKFIREKVLPAWWTDDVDQTPEALTEGALYLSRRLNLDLTSLLYEETPRLISIGSPKFKTGDGTDFAKLAVPYALAGRIAELVGYGFSQPYQDVADLTVAEIRRQILEQYPCLNLEGLLNFCSSSGIPVIHFSQVPQGCQRFHGMVTVLQGRPIILVSRNDQSPAWLTFIIAHELGHILWGHLADTDVLLDEEISLESDDQEEDEANRAAAELILGHPGISYDLWAKFLKAKTLADRAQQFAEESHNDPGVIALNIAWNRAHRAKTKKEANIAWATGKKALQMLEGDRDAPRQINQRLVSHLDWDVLGDENRDYLITMLNL
jgi:hypothetical protein